MCHSLSEGSGLTRAKRIAKIQLTLPTYIRTAKAVIQYSRKRAGNVLSFARIKSAS